MQLDMEEVSKSGACAVPVAESGDNLHPLFAEWVVYMVSR